MTKITIIGITHVDSTSQEKVAEYLRKIAPDAVCLELDEYRFKTLLENEKSSMTERTNEEPSLDKELIVEGNEGDVSGIVEGDLANSFLDLFAQSSILEDIGFFETELANLLQTGQPGKEMIIAYKIAEEIGAKVYLIDRSIEEIAQMMEEEVSAKEAGDFREMVDELILDEKIKVESIDEENLEPSPDSLKIENEEKEETINLNEILEIFKDEESLNQILTAFNQTFPKLASVLLKDRDSYMAQKIVEVANKHQNIVVVLGYGHINEIVKQLKKLNESLEIVIMN